jgi:DNA-binding transcriptional regulator YiaG
MSGERRCAACHGELEDCTETLSVELPRSDVTAQVSAPAARCAGCGVVRVEPEVRARADLALARALADAGAHGGDAFRVMRKALALRAADLARLLAVTPETVSHWETGKALPARCAFATLAAMIEDALGGRRSTRDRLEALAEGRPLPRTVAAALDPLIPEE